MLDLELLNTLVCVVDEGSFTRAGERVHRTQSTVSQQVRKLEELVGRPLLLRDRAGTQVTTTEHGAMLTQYARRLLALSQEAQDALASDVKLTPVRIGVPEDFDARRMSAMLSGFVKAQPGARLETVAGMSADLQRKLAAGEIEIALIKREPGSGECLAAWPESLVWVQSAEAGWQAEAGDEPIPLALFPHGCVYRQRAIRSLDKSHRRWRIAFGSQSLTGIQAAVSSGLGISVLPTTAVLPEHRLCEGLPSLPPTELALVTAGGVLNAAQRTLVEFLQEGIADLGRAETGALARGFPD
ncbi:LysR substrate-binding domain-containing protein [Paraburkholderia caballeronis]|uniref:DNA-binding transcriptional regulator, LysR family n=1 Tax=Paraburkholderia caballeronis TaxID=416943 RepID=A0A1H7SYZ6_9BURK|nr:LysR substrate-binding domain-containing protein [Paraburkholderia caballeronis]PXW25749.1 LysR family transcriptional regulator [Paraburkholderia caballeronis]PXX01356.1 LysR family transcriptional regulator [Paraburkholderia caballeronis]RAJ99290.1 LysR family transcriptional regulator [Paraburkholderia caballeronis]SEE24082.1 transcriptional regulator, LysR family [Paraburkholderia caballeronis]SEL77811.1 DNA-binding transcriptional regulator, LysR family [Paraburkholderia caballeronis]